MLQGCCRTLVGEYQKAGGTATWCQIACEHCGGAVKVIASIEDPAVIKQILDHLKRRAEAATPVFRPFARAPPQAPLPGLNESG